MAGQAIGDADAKWFSIATTVRRHDQRQKESVSPNTETEKCCSARGTFHNF
jgi:hypothetical protein